MTPTVAWTVISILSIIIFTQLYFLIRFVRYIFDMEDSAQNSIDSLEAIRARLQNVLETPLFFDSQPVKNVVADISSALNVVDNIIAMSGEAPNDIEEGTTDDVIRKG